MPVYTTDEEPPLTWGPATLAARPALVEAKTLAVARRIGGVPRSQQVMHKLVVN